MPLALLLITVGGIMIYTALHGVTVADALGGQKGDTLDAKGGGQGDFSGSGDFGGGGNFAPDPGVGPPILPPADQAGGGGGKALLNNLSGPHRDLLIKLGTAAADNFNLTITNTCRSLSHNAAVGGATHSMHLACRAFDAAGKASDMAAFAKWVWKNYGSQVAEVYYAPAGITGKNGRNYFPGVFDNPTMVHVSA